MKSVCQKISAFALAVVFTAATFLWVSSYFRKGWLLVEANVTGEICVQSGCGYIYGYWFSTVPGSWLGPPSCWYNFLPYSFRPRWWVAHEREPIFIQAENAARRKAISPRLKYYFVPGFEFQVSTPDGDDAYFVIFPIWVIVAASGLPLAFKLRWLLRKRWRLSHGLCIACGYDLRHSKDKCPECGTITQNTSADGVST